MTWNGFERYKRLASAYAPPGMEFAVRKELTDLLRPFVSHLDTDPIGNLYASFGSQNDPCIMLSAHMDEVALIVSGITRDGLLRVKPQGYLRPEQFDQQPVVILTSQGLIDGVSMIKASDHDLTIDSIRIDIGVDSPESAKQTGIQLGDRICYQACIEESDSGIVTGKSADDRTGIYALVGIAERLFGKALPVKVVLVGTVQEEAIDTYAAWAGASVAAKRIDPVLMLGIDTYNTSKPDLEDVYGITLEGGLGILRGAQDLHHGLVNHVLSKAQEMEITHQVVPLPSTAADYTTIMRAGFGVPCAGLVVPVHNSHYRNEIFLWKTLEDVVTLLIDLLENSPDLLAIAGQAP